MGTPGFEDWTLADIERLNAQRRPQVRADIQPDKLHPVMSEQIASELVGNKPRHKYRAEPCIVTEDFTLFTLKDIEQAETSLPIGRLGSLLSSLKSRAKACGIIGEWFGSTKEGKRWIELRQMEIAGEIRELKRQVAVSLCCPTLDGRAVEVAVYRADFVFYDSDNRLRMQDTKGQRTAMYTLKSKWVERQHGITIEEI